MPEILTGEWTLSREKRQEHMKAAIATGLPFIQTEELFHGSKMSIVGYGPSLRETWESIPHTKLNAGPIMTTSGAYDFLANRGMQSEFYIAIDPRESTIDLLDGPDLNTTYLMASCLHPRWWEVLNGFDVLLWHLEDGPQTIEWVKKNHPEGVDALIGGGSTVCNRAFNVAAALGYRKFDVFGMDGCLRDGERWAGPHNGQPQQRLGVFFNGKRYETTPQLWQSVKEMKFLLENADIDVTFHGEGLMQDIAKAIKEKS